MTEFDPTTEQEVEVEVRLPVRTPEYEGAEETPPPPPFLIVEGKFGPGTVGCYFPDGTPVGRYVHDEMPAATSEEVFDILSDMGLEERYCAMYAEHRRLRDYTAREAFASTAVQDMMASEVQREKDLKPIREAFVKAQQKKQK